MEAKLTLETAKEFYKQGGAAKQFALDNYSESELNDIIYVPKKIGLLLNSGGSLFHLYFNNSKQILCGDDGYYNVSKNIYGWTQSNNGNNFKLVETTYDKLESGDLFFDGDIERDLDILYCYNIKTDFGYVYFNNGIQENYNEIKYKKVYKVEKI